MTYNNFNTNKPSLKITFVLNYFGANNLNKIAKIYNFVQFFINQKPFLKIVYFKNLKKKILKSFVFVINLKNRLFSNFINYIKFYYFYFYSVYYEKQITYSYNLKMINYNLINPNFFFKNYKLNHKFALRISLNSSGNKNFFQTY